MAEADIFRRIEETHRIIDSVEKLLADTEERISYFLPASDDCPPGFEYMFHRYGARCLYTSQEFFDTKAEAEQACNKLHPNSTLATYQPSSKATLEYLLKFAERKSQENKDMRGYRFYTGNDVEEYEIIDYTTTQRPGIPKSTRPYRSDIPSPFTELHETPEPKTPKPGPMCVFVNGDILKTSIDYCDGMGRRIICELSGESLQ
ncbi:hypothetical protein CAPTEDRAFT_194268 [Capitella teleta]|uniref:Uncharacterized protein n=1 Tax=Capitella teleta TaxID=283909 RepID=R7TPQ8_CAPTE|nr:hypothetical protein CAPTEDRAFT_194268 [Capitella teleta]|eukprot:ELT93501.1 hypothetical protein CAPTEDRAFT_194268 [Capitella teleta]